MRQTSTKPQIPVSLFPHPPLQAPLQVPLQAPPPGPRPASNTSKRRVESNDVTRKSSDDFDDGGLDDDELVQASFNEPPKDLEFDDIDNYANPNDVLTKKNTAKNAGKKTKDAPIARTNSVAEAEEAMPLPNGKWPCNHKCKDKTACRHLCCHQGVDKPPKRPAKKNENERPVSTKAPEKALSKSTQSKLHVTPLKRKASESVEVLDLTQEERKKKQEVRKKVPWDCRNLHQLHKSIQKKDPPQSISAIMHKQPTYNYSRGGGHSLAFMDAGERRGGTAMSTDYSDLEVDDLMDIDGFVPRKARTEGPNREMQCARASMPDFEGNIAANESDKFGDDDSQLEEALVGLADSQNMQPEAPSPFAEYAEDFGIDDEVFKLNFDDAYMGEHQTEDIVQSTHDPYRTPTDPPEVMIGCTTSPLFERPAHDEPDMRKAGHTQPRDATVDEDQISSPFFAKPAGNLKQEEKETGFRPAKSMLKGGHPREVAEETRTAQSDMAQHTPTIENLNKNPIEENIEPEYALPTAVEEIAKEKTVEERYKNIEQWFLQEFGDVVELVDD